MSFGAVIFGGLGFGLGCGGGGAGGAGGGATSTLWGSSAGGAISINSIGTVIGWSGLACITKAASGISAKWISEEAVNDESKRRSITSGLLRLNCYRHSGHINATGDVHDFHHTAMLDIVVGIDDDQQLGVLLELLAQQIAERGLVNLLFVKKNS
jgi:hypothetical protein